MKWFKVLTLASVAMACVMSRCDCGKDTGTGPVERVYRSSLVGTVVDKNSKGLAGVSVTTRPDGHNTTTLSDGSFELPDLVAGREYALHFHLMDYRDTAVGAFELGLADVDTLDEPMRMVFRFGSLSGTVYLDRDTTIPAGGAGIEVEKQDIAKLLPTGAFTLNRIEPDPRGGPVRLLAVRPGLGFGHLEVKVLADSAIENLALILDRAGGTVTGRVVDDGGAPASGVEVTALGGALATTTDDSGTYVLANVPTLGAVTLQFSTQGVLQTQVTGVVAEEAQVVSVAAVALQTPVVDQDAGVTLTPTTASMKQGDSLVVLRVVAQTEGSVRTEWYYWDYDGSTGWDDSTALSWVEVSNTALKWQSGQTKRTVYVRVLTTLGEYSDSVGITLTRATSQSTDTVAPALLTGTVVDETLQPLQGVAAWLTVADLGDTTGADGVFAITTTGLDSTGDTLTVDLDGYVPWARQISAYRGDLGNIVLKSIPDTLDYTPPPRDSLAK